MKANQAASMKLMLAHEGGYVNHPKDPGGATNKGVTQATYDAYRANKGLPARSVKLITTAELNEIYDKNYWDKAKCDDLPAGVDYAVFDYSVNSGPSRAIKDLQRTLNANAAYNLPQKLAVDGVPGDRTIRGASLAAAVDEEGLIEAYCKRRMNFLRSLKTWGTFGRGWNRRVNGDFDGFQEGDYGVVDLAIMMARDDLTYPVRKGLLPHAIGLKSGEISGKGVESDKSAFKAPEGIGAALGAAGAGGTTLVNAATQVQPHIGDTFIGRLALVGFVLLILLGVGLVSFDWFRKQREKAAG